MPQFLSDPWFEAVDQLRAEVGELDVPDAIKELVINVTVSGHPDGGDKELRLEAGNMEAGHKDGAPTLLTIPYAVAKAMLVDGDTNAAMQAFMAGEIKIDGDMAAMMQMQAAGTPSAKAVELQKKIQAITE